jgi:hypothetical protein
MVKHERIPCFACVLLIAATACVSREETARREADQELLKQQYIDSVTHVRQEQQAAQESLVQTRQVRTAVNSMELLERKGYNGQVLQMNNLQPYGFDLDVKCHRIDGVAKTLFIKIRPRSLSEAGSGQGWPGNFQAGEWCELIYRGEVIRSYRFNPPNPFDIS